MERVIELTRINGKKFFLNHKLIEFIETTPDTVISLTTERKVVVLEKVDEVVDLVLEFERKRNILPNMNKYLEREV